MKRIFLFLTLFTLIFTGYGQKSKKRLSLGKTFLKKVRIREVLDTMLWDYETKIFNQTEGLFKKHKLDVYKDNDYEFFQSALMHQFLFSKRHILNRVAYQYKHKDYKTLEKYVKRIDKGELQAVIFDSGLYEMLKKLLKQEMTQVEKMTVPKYLQFIVNRHKPVPIKIKHNEKEVPASKLDLNVYVETNNADYKRVSILDKKNNTILKPEGYTYEQIQKIVVEFKGKKFDFKPDKAIDLYPHQFKEVNSMISKYSFNEIPVWDLDVMESNGHIGVQLTNVVESKVIKSKTPPDHFEKEKKILK